MTAQAATAVPPFATVADLLVQLGGIPPHRIRLRPRPGTATESDFVEVELREDRLRELVDGVLVEKAEGFFASYLAASLVHIFCQFVEQKDLGIVVGADGMVRLWPGLVRIPDVAFISWDRLPNRQIPREPIPDLVPDLSVEALSEGNTAQEMDRKLREYFSAGVRLVWYVESESRVVPVHSATDKLVKLDQVQSLDGGVALPGFTLSLRAWFATADRPHDSLC